MSRRLTPFRFAALAAVALLLLFVLVSGLTLLSARQALAQGMAEVRQAQREITPSHSHLSSQAVRRAEGDMARAEADFHDSDSRLGLYAPLLRGLAWVPRVGDQLAASPDAAHVADLTALGILQLLHGLQPVIDRAGGGHASLPTLVVDLAGQGGSFSRANARFLQAEQVRAHIHGSSRTLTSALHSLDRELPRLSALSRALELLPSALGAQRPRTYLLAYQDPAELRATGGYIGSMGLLTFQRGRVSQRFSGTSFPQQFEGRNASVPSPDPVAFYNREPFWLFMDSNWSPDFPTTAQLERYFLRLNFHRDVDGVIDITPQAAADILTITGPMDLPEYGRVVTGGNVAQLADYYAHWTDVHGPYRYSNADTERVQFIGIVAQHLIRRMESLSPSGWLRLGGSLGGAVSRRDILLNVRDPGLQSLVREAGADGAVRATPDDYLYVVDTNLSYNKLNGLEAAGRPFVHLSYHDTVQIRPDRWLHHSLTLTFRNAAPAYMRSHGAGPGGGLLGRGDDYATFLRVYVPAGAQLVDQSGWTQPWSPGPAYGKTMFCGYLIVPHGRARTIHLSYVVPPNVFSASGGRDYRLLVQHQPGSHPDSVSISVVHDGTSISRTVQHPQQDFQVTVNVVSRPFHPIPLPRQPPEVVAPGHRIEPHAYLSAPRG